MKLIDYTELCKLELRPTTRVNVVHCDCNRIAKYSYISTYKWAVNVYSVDFCKEHNIMFEVK